MYISVQNNKLYNNLIVTSSLQLPVKKSITDLSPGSIAYDSSNKRLVGGSLQGPVVFNTDLSSPLCICFTEDSIRSIRVRQDLFFGINPTSAFTSMVNFCINVPNSLYSKTSYSPTVYLGEHNLFLGSSFDISDVNLLGSTDVKLIGGFNNRIDGSRQSHIALLGGDRNAITSSSLFSSIGPCSSSTISDSVNTLILNGSSNSIQNSNTCFISNGSDNTILNSFGSSILSGSSCSIESGNSCIVNGNSHSIIGGITNFSIIFNGQRNVIVGPSSFIINGESNRCGNESFIVNGFLNSTGSDMNFIENGTLNRSFSNEHGLILNGEVNRIQSSKFSFILNGNENIISTSSANTFNWISNGTFNQINNLVSRSSIINGDLNSIINDSASSNSIPYQSIMNGLNNSISFKEIIRRINAHSIIYNGQENVIESSPNCSIYNGFDNSISVASEIPFAVIFNGVSNSLRGNTSQVLLFNNRNCNISSDSIFHSVLASDSCSISFSNSSITASCIPSITLDSTSNTSFLSLSNQLFTYNYRSHTSEQYFGVRTFTISTPSSPSYTLNSDDYIILVRPLTSLSANTITFNLKNCTFNGKEIIIRVLSDTVFNVLRFKFTSIQDDGFIYGFNYNGLGFPEYYLPNLSLPPSTNFSIRLLFNNQWIIQQLNPIDELID